MKSTYIKYNDIYIILIYVIYYYIFLMDYCIDKREILWYNEYRMDINKLRCRAMIDAGVRDPCSSEGINFCVTQCPYTDGCVLFEQGGTRKKEQKNLIKGFARRLHSHGVSVVDVSLILHKSERTVQRYLK